MKKFLKSCALFAVPIVVFVCAVEMIVTKIPNSYSYKYNYVKNNGQKIQALAIGHSQLYDGFNPEFFHLPSFNLCNSAQSYMDDFYLLEELIGYIPNLKMAILPIGYMNFKTSDSTVVTFDYRGCYYHEYMNIDYDGQLPFAYRYEWANLSQALSKISAWRKHVDIVGCDSLGMRSTHHLSAREMKLGTEHFIEGYTRFDVENDFILGHEKYLIKIIKLLNDNKVQVVLVSPPYYWQCTQNYNRAQKHFSDNYISNLCKKYPSIKYIDFETDTTFVYDDFFNETHLSDVGAEKLTRKLREILQE